MSDLRKLRGARKEVAIIDKLKGRVSLIHAVGSLCTSKCLVKWADWFVAKKRAVSAEKH